MAVHPSRRDLSGSQDTVSQLSCELCSERKVRCDKLNPCSTCTATGATCKPVYRKRRPRGRHVKSLDAENKDLQQRLARLEELVANQIPTEPVDVSVPSTSHGLALSPSATTPCSQITTTSSVSGTNRTASPRYIANDFWVDLVDTHPGLHGILSDNKAEPDRTANRNIGNSASVGNMTSRSRQYSPDLSHTSQHNFANSILGFGFAHHQTYVDAALALRPPSAVCQKLCQAYIDRVHPPVKVLHRPTLIGFLLRGKTYLNYNDTDPVLDLLRAAVFFLTVVTLSDEQCISAFDTGKSSLIATHRLACELALDRVGLIATEDITVLQSFVLYLIALRSYDRSRIAWTLFATAARLAIALGINSDNNRTSESFFEQQMRRRLWFTICHLDSHLSFDRGSEPLLRPKIQPMLPLNINDDDFGPDSEQQDEERDSFTEMSLALLHYRIQSIGRSSTNPEDSPSGDTAEKVARLESETKKLLQNCDPNSSSFAWGAYNGSLSMLAGMQLYLRRPIAYNGRPRTTTENDSTNVLRLAVTVLEHEIIKRTDPRGEPFRWFAMVQWHPLAVAITECYACDNVTLLRHVWPTIETSFEYHSSVLAQYRQGVLYKPLERLMLRTRARVKSLLDQSHNMACSETDGSTGKPNPRTAVQSEEPDSSTIHIASPSNILNPSLDVSASLAGAQAGAMPAQGNQDILPLDFAFDESLWDLVTPSMLEHGRETWDEFINEFNFDAIDGSVAHRH